ncbi:MAG: diguanylate cyclase [Verrucomicrobiota bacterium]
MSAWVPILASGLFSILWQTVAVAAVCFAAAILLVSHLRYQRMSLEAHDEDGSSMKTDEAFRIRIARYLGSMHREPAPFSTIIFTLHDIESLHEEFGDDSVDDMMNYLLDELKAVLRASDSVLRYDRHRIGLVAAVGLDGVESFLSRLHRSSELEAFRTRSGVLKKLRVRIGVSTCPENGDTVYQLMGAAEKALQLALAELDSSWQIAQGMVEREVERDVGYHGDAPPERAVGSEADAGEEDAEAGDKEAEESPRDGGLLGLLGRKSAPARPPAPEADAGEEDTEAGDTEVEEPPRVGGLLGLLGRKSAPARSPAPEADAGEEDAKAGDEEVEESPRDGGLFGLLGRKSAPARSPAPETEDEEEGDEAEDEDDEDALAKNIDPLTGLLRSERVGGALQKYVARYRKDEEPVTLLYMDIDSLEQYNEHYGEAAGDAILTKLGEILDHGVRQEDLLGRVGGEEFIIGMNVEAASALVAAKRLCALIKASAVYFGGNKLRFTVCIGVAGFPDHGGVAKTLFDRSLIAMRAAKYRGRSKCMMYDPQLRSSRVADPEEPVTEDAF